MIIREETNRRMHRSLLFLADEQEDMIDRYLDRGTMFVLEEGGSVFGECVVTDEGNGILEIKNLAIAQQYQRQGYGKKLIEYVAERYKDKYDTLQVGTGDSSLTVPFYENCGFSQHHRLKNFFTNNYDHPIFEDGKQLVDMVVLRRKNKSFRTGSRKVKEDSTMAKAENNKWGLVYDGAITENIEGEVNIRPVSYCVNGVKVVANVYTPAGYDEKSDKKYPAVTVAHPNGGVKEQVSGLFAQKLAENGYIAIACDAAYQGASEGEPRNTDIPTNRIEDIHAMVDYLITFPGVDAERIGLFGICGGGGYTLKAAQTEKRAKAVATLSAFNTGIVRLFGLGNSQVDTIQQRLKEAADARTEEARTGEVVYPAPRGQITQEYIESLPDGLYKDGMYYYGRDYAHPNSGGQAPVKNLLDLVDFDARQNMDLINVPLLMMTGSEADTLYMTKDCFELATGTENKELFIIEGARHIPTYFVPEFVEQEANKLMEFFGKNL